MIKCLGEILQIDMAVPAKGELLEVVPGIHWLRMPLPMSLNHINLYLLDEGDGWTLIDTGMNTEETRDSWQLLFDSHLSAKPIKQIVVTHMHPDHVGLAGWLSEHFRCPIYMSQLEYFAVRAYCASTEMDWQLEQFIRRCGMDDDYVDYMRNRLGFGGIVSPMPQSFKRLEQDQVLRLGGRDWRVIIGAGHSLAHACLYCEADKLLLAGDQLLPKISPNVSVMATEPDASPLHAWFDSLDYLRSLDVATLVFPAHNKPFTGVHARAVELIEHHEMQLQLLLVLCQQEQTVEQLLEPMFGRKIHYMEMGLALGECKAHLHMLMDRGQMHRDLRAGIEYYRSLVLGSAPLDMLAHGSFQV